MEKKIDAERFHKVIRKDSLRYFFYFSFIQKHFYDRDTYKNFYRDVSHFCYGYN